MNYSDSSALADMGASRHRRGRRLVLYLSLTLLVPLFVGLTALLGAPAPAKTPPQSPGVGRGYRALTCPRPSVNPNRFWPSRQKMCLC